MAVSRENPFPGMNPWLEAEWSDVHLALIGFLRQDLGGKLPDDLVARAEKHVAITDSSGKTRHYRADVAIQLRENPPETWRSGLPPIWAPDDSQEGGLKVAEPKFVVEEQPPERWIEILDTTGSLVTVIEVISRSNKGANREEYRSRRADYLAGVISVVEIDLLRGGHHTVNVSKDFIDPATACLVCVSRVWTPWRKELYDAQLRQRLPCIRVPLRLDDSDVVLDIQSLVNRAYETGRYWTLDYSREPQPPLSEEDAEWARQQLLAAGLIED